MGILKNLGTWMKNHKILTVVVFLILAGAAYYFLFYKNGNEEEAGQMKTQTEEVTKGNIEISVSGSGQIEAKSQVDLKPVVAGDAIEVQKVYVENDQEVKKNQIIALLDSEDAQKSIRDAEISLRAAQIKMAEIEKQYDTKTEDDRWMRQAQEIAVQQSLNNLNDAKEKLEDYYIKAPFDGIVTDLSVEAGDSISQSDILASVITDELVARITLNEVDAAQVQVGDKANLTFDALSDVSAEGKVSKVDTIGEVESGVVSYEIEISFDSPSEYLKPGMSVNTEIEIEKKTDILVISSSAIKTDEGGNSYVLVSSGMQNNADQSAQPQLKRQEIETGISNDTQTEVTSGLSEGDIILLTSSSSSSSNTSTQNSSGGLLNFGGGPGGRPDR